MLLTLTVTPPTDSTVPASDLGYLLHKHPDRVQEFSVPAGTATVLYPEASDDRCTVALLVSVDPAELVTSKFRRGRDGFDLGQYVNDRPYTASSLLAVALSTVFGSAMAGTCAAREDLVDVAFEITVTIAVLPSRGEIDLPSRLFGPLGWSVDATPIDLDPTVPDWGASDYVHFMGTATLTVRDALRHLYVLLPVLDDTKHYWVGDDEADKLVRVAGDWLSGHPESTTIMTRYLAHRKELVRSVAERLLGSDTEPEVRTDRPLAVERLTVVTELLRTAGAHRVVDVGCGEGRLLKHLESFSAFTELVGIDVSARELDRARDRLGIADMSDARRERVSLLHSSATYRDDRLRGFDAAVVMEVIEHIDAPRLPALVRSVFGDARPRTVVVTTPNAEYNVLYPALRPGEFRHPDHRFEFDRPQFDRWCADVAAAHDYSYLIDFIGPAGVDPAGRPLGGPTQYAVFDVKVIPS